MEAREAAVVEGDAEVLEERERPAVEGTGLVLKPEELAEEVFRDLDAQRGGVDVGRLAEDRWRLSDGPRVKEALACEKHSRGPNSRHGPSSMLYCVSRSR